MARETRSLNGSSTYFLFTALTIIFKKQRFTKYTLRFMFSSSFLYIFVPKVKNLIIFQLLNISKQSYHIILKSMVDLRPKFTTLSHFNRLKFEILFLFDGPASISVRN